MCSLARPVFARNCKKTCASQIMQNRAKIPSFRRGERLNISRPNPALMRIWPLSFFALPNSGLVVFAGKSPRGWLRSMPTVWNEATQAGEPVSLDVLE